jgi:hypothetical protein
LRATAVNTRVFLSSFFFTFRGIVASLAAARRKAEIWRDAGNARRKRRF